MSRFEIKPIVALMLSEKEYLSRMRQFNDATAYRWGEDILKEASHDSEFPSKDFLRPWFIHPILLGGQVTYANFALIAINFEKRWHDFIFSQTGEMKVGETKNILVPTMTGHKAWYDLFSKCHFGG